MDASRTWEEPEQWEEPCHWVGPRLGGRGRDTEKLKTPKISPSAWRSAFNLPNRPPKQPGEKESYSSEADPVPWIQPCLKPAALSFSPSPSVETTLNSDSKMSSRILLPVGSSSRPSVWASCAGAYPLRAPHTQQQWEAAKEPLPACPGCQGTPRQCCHRVWAGVGTSARRP